jgi:hypothetical protein
MPPERPQPKGETIGELTVMDGGRVTSEREITADEMA